MAGDSATNVDLWADAPFDHLPAPLVRAFEQQAWPTVKTELREIMDGMITDGPYGRELLTLVRKLPIGADPLFDRYHAMVSADFGDWDALQRCLEAEAPYASEVLALREQLLAPLSRVGPPASAERYLRFTSELHEFGLSQEIKGYRHWIARILTFRPIDVWTRGDVPVGRHARYRELHDTFFMGLVEANFGRLPVAVSCAMEAQHLGDEGEPLRLAAIDVERLAAAALGDSVPDEIQFWSIVRRSTGPSPWGTWQIGSPLLPLAAAVRHPSMEWATELFEQIAVGLGSPRIHFQAEAWRIAARMILHGETAPRGLPSLLAHSTHAAPGLRVLPTLLNAVAAQEPAHFLEAARLALRCGNVWAHTSALIWAMALGPTPRHARRLYQLLETTGRRRAPLVPPDILSEAALGLISVGVRGRAVVELAAVSGRPNPTVEVARAHLDDASVALADKVHAIEALAAVGSGPAMDLLRRTAVHRDDVGRRAASLLARPHLPLGLSEREVEVLELAAKGLTNREIAEQLVISPHTVARHLANARDKLGAANRAEAATLLATLPYRGGRAGDPIPSHRPTGRH